MKRATFKSLTAAEKKHLEEVADCRTLAAFKETAKHQKIYRDQIGSIEPCYTCKHIAIKLGLEV